MTTIGDGGRHRGFERRQISSRSWLRPHVNFAWLRLLSLTRIWVDNHWGMPLILDQIIVALMDYSNSGEHLFIISTCNLSWASPAQFRFPSRRFQYLGWGHEKVVGHKLLPSVPQFSFFFPWLIAHWVELEVDRSVKGSMGIPTISESTAIQTETASGSVNFR